jgi:hypothetical protein
MQITLRGELLVAGIEIDLCHGLARSPCLVQQRLAALEISLRHAQIRVGRERLAHELIERRRFIQSPPGPARRLAREGRIARPDERSLGGRFVDDRGSRRAMVIRPDGS